jgi:hypothetical protein
MLALRQISPLVIREYGTHRMTIIYTLSGVCGFLVSYLAGVGFTIGASAAVCGLIGAALYYGKRRGGVYGHAVYRQVGGWALGIVLFGLVIPGINNWAHGGGMAAGILVGLLSGYHERKKENMLHRLLGGNMPCRHRPDSLVGSVHRPVIRLAPEKKEVVSSGSGYDSLPPAIVARRRGPAARSLPER